MEINKRILSGNVGLASSEDKRLGAFFVTEDDLRYDSSESDSTDPMVRRQAASHNGLFPEKVLKYLWDDAFRFDRTQVFHERYQNLEDVITTFEKEKGDRRFGVFKQDVVSAICGNQD